MKQGHDVQLLEARMRPGGRVYTLRDSFADGLYAEALTDWTIGGDGVSALFVSFTNIASQAAAENLGRRILKLI